MFTTRRNKTCCFTGHRKLQSVLLSQLRQELEQTVRQLIGEGICYFGAGGALGFDTLAAEVVLQLRQEFPHIRLILVLPCPNQTRGWPLEDVVRYEHIKAAADKVVFVSSRYTPSCMHKRNRHLVDCSSVCVAYCTSTMGGTAFTVNYAQAQKVRVLFVATGLLL